MRSDQAIILVDSEDYYPDERAWIDTASALTPGRAERMMEEYAPLPDKQTVYFCDGKSWYRKKQAAPESGWERCSADEPDGIEFWEVLLTDKEDKFPQSYQTSREKY